MPVFAAIFIKANNTKIKANKQVYLFSGFHLLLVALLVSFLISFHWVYNCNDDCAINTIKTVIYGTYTGKKTPSGADVYHKTGSINWLLIDSTKINFMICKASEGGDFKDPKFKDNWDHLSRLKIIKGAYHFLAFKSNTAHQQADNFLSCGMNYSQPNVLPPFLDVEWQQLKQGDKYFLRHRDVCIKLIGDWLKEVKQRTGRTPVIYTDFHFWRKYLHDTVIFNNYPLWTDGYYKDGPILPRAWKSFVFWQCNRGKLNFIDGEVDIDRFNGSFEDLRKLTAVSKSEEYVLNK